MNIRSQRTPSIEFFRQISRTWKDEGLSRLLFRGVIQLVDRFGNNERPRFSICAKVKGIDSPSDKKEGGRWFPPLLPIQQMSIPEVGEEVILICEEIGNINTAFWISRVVTQNTLTKNEIGAAIADRINKQEQKSSSQYGFDGSVPKESKDKSPDENYLIPDPRVKPGDVVVQGRSNTFNRHTFDTKNVAGYVETITEESAVSDDTFFKDDFRKSKGSREVLATKSDLDTQIIEKINELKFDRSYLKGTDSDPIGYPEYDMPYKKADGINTNKRSNNKYEDAYLLLEAIELRLISRKGKEVQHTVLAEEQERWLILLINLTRDLIDDVILFRDHVDKYRENVDKHRENVDAFRQEGFETHTHMTSVGPSSTPLEKAISYSKTSFANNLKEDHQHFEDDHQNFENDKVKFQKNKEDYEKHKQPIPLHHSKTLAIN